MRARGRRQAVGAMLRGKAPCPRPSRSKVTVRREQGENGRSPAQGLPSARGGCQGQDGQAGQSDPNGGLHQGKGGPVHDPALPAGEVDSEDIPIPGEQLGGGGGHASKVAFSQFPLMHNCNRLAIRSRPSYLVPMLLFLLASGLLLGGGLGFLAGARPGVAIGAAGTSRRFVLGADPGYPGFSVPAGGRFFRRVRLHHLGPGRPASFPGHLGGLRRRGGRHGPAFPPCPEARSLLRGRP